MAERLTPCLDERSECDAEAALVSFFECVCHVSLSVINVGAVKVLVCNFVEGATRTTTLPLVTKACHKYKVKPFISHAQSWRPWTLPRGPGNACSRRIRRCERRVKRLKVADLPECPREGGTLLLRRGFVLVKTTNRSFQLAHHLETLSFYFTTRSDIFWCLLLLGRHKAF